jgi:hypothetical protein
MQAEKYLFHLSKWGLAAEKTLTLRSRSAAQSSVEVDETT